MRKVAVGLGLAFVLGLVAFGARQVTAAVFSPEETPPGAEAAPDTERTTTTAPTSTPAPDNETTETTLKATAPADEPTGEDEPEIVIGDPTIIPVDFVPVPDTISVKPGFVVDLDVFVASQTQIGQIGPVVESGDDADSGSLTLADPLIVDPKLAPEERGFGAGIWADPEHGHHATINVGVNLEGNGLAELIVDFGDGSTLDLDNRHLNELRDGGVVEIVHRYEPTLTPQRQTASVRARDTSGEMRESTTSFTTRAQFLAGFSPLTVTALGDCDFFGKGDFVMNWNIDGRDKSSSFKLGEGDTYVEQGFRIGIDGIYYQEPHPVKLSISEEDSLASDFIKGITWQHEFVGSGHGPGILLGVLELGTHVIPYSGVQDIGDCDVRVDFAVNLALSERAGN
jgi:hypothetical protein